MKKNYLIPLSIIFLVGCNSAPNQVEIDYIKNLEEKNKILEQELSDLRNSNKNKVSINSERLNEEEYFTLGSTIKRVIEVMGNPSSYTKVGPFSTMYFGLSSVKFENGTVSGYDNTDGNLKIKLTE